jgi:hypothetical protein
MIYFGQWKIDQSHPPHVKEFLDGPGIEKPKEACGIECQLGNLKSQIMAMGSQVSTIDAGQKQQDKEIKQNTDEMAALQKRIKDEEAELAASLKNPQSQSESGGHVDKHLGPPGGPIHPPGEENKESFTDFHLNYMMRPRANPRSRPAPFY